MPPNHRTLSRYAPLLCLACLLCAPPVKADVSGWQLAANALILADWGQTRHIAANGEEDGYEETNPILGPRPSTSEVNLYFASALVLTNGVGWLLPEPWERRWFIAVTAVQGAVVAHNHSIGLRIEF